MTPERIHDLAWEIAWRTTGFEFAKRGGDKKVQLTRFELALICHATAVSSLNLGQDEEEQQS